MKNCFICNAEFENIDKNIDVCSISCAQAQELLKEGSQFIEGTRPSEDTRIFFYPMSFGKLCDLYCIMSIKRANTRSVRNQQETDYKLSRIKRNLVTMLGQLFFDPANRKAMSELTIKLFRLNAEVWALRDTATNHKYDKETRKIAALDLITLSGQRNGIIQQLDILHSGRTYTYKVCNGEEI